MFDGSEITDERTSFQTKKLTFQCCLEYLFRKFSNKKTRAPKISGNRLNKAGLVSSDNIYRAVDAHISRLEYIYTVGCENSKPGE